MKKIWLSLLIIAFSFTIFSSCSPKNKLEDIAKNLTNYEIEATFNDVNKEITATQTVNFINSYEVPLASLSFHLYPAAYRSDATIKPISEHSKIKAYPKGFSEGNITITEVKIAGNLTDFFIEGQDKDILIIPLNKEIFPDERIIVSFNFNLKIPNAHHRLGYGDKAINLGNWFPILSVYENGAFLNTPYYSNGDPFYSEAANYNILLTTPLDYKIASTGTFISESTNGSNKISNFKAEIVRDFAMVLSTEFEIKSEIIEGVEIKYYYYNDTEWEKSLKIASESIQTFNRLFGKYPYSTLAVVQTHFSAGGMEYPTLIYISDKYKTETYREIIVHEIAHQWWYAVVGSDQVKHAWLDEGLTSYSTILFYEQNPQYYIKRETLIKSSLQSYRSFMSISSQVFGKEDTSMNRAVNEFRSEYEYTHLTYVKGELMFDAIRNFMSEQKFYTGLKKYYSDNMFKTASPENFITSMEKGGHVKIENFVQSWLLGKVVL